ncbi:MAG: helix-turn-helix domain-containing protein [Lachnospiraceae bacterium]|nr:helix-turn-helix domain-containing protein [Lachnospiraceae bacterium]
MILADKIINERKKNGWSQEELAEMLSVSRQSVSKWESAQAAPDLNRIIKMAEIFGVSTDYLLKDDIEEYEKNDSSDFADDASNIRRVSLEDAQRYINIVKRNTPSAVIATMLFVLCPVTLIMLAGISNYVPGSFSEAVAVVIGIIVLLIAIISGVAIWIAIEAKEKEYDFFEKEDYDTLYGVDGMAKEGKVSFEKKRVPLLVVAIGLCILSPVGVITAGILEASEMLIISMIGLLLIMIAIAVGIFIYLARNSKIYSNLLMENKLNREQRERKRIISKISGAYWCVVVAVFLVLGLGFDRWEIAGVLFPVAGVLFAAILAIVKIFSGDD